VQVLWDVRASVDAATRSLVWDLSAAVGTTRVFLWELYAERAKQLGLVWDTNVPIDGLARSFVWDTRNPVSGSQRVLLWDLVGTSERTLTLLWGLESGVAGPGLVLRWHLFRPLATGKPWFVSPTDFDGKPMEAADLEAEPMEAGVELTGASRS
jgi:hypothetical protein